jgi:hypothetical protein
MATTLFAIWIVGIFLVLATGVCWRWLGVEEMKPGEPWFGITVFVAFFWPAPLFFFVLPMGIMRVWGKIEDELARRRFARGEW